MYKEFPCGCYFEHVDGVATTKACNPVHKALIEALLP